MSGFFSKIASLFDAPPLTAGANYQTITSFPAGVRILVAPPELPAAIRWANLSEERRREVDAQGCITTRPFSFDNR